MKRFFKDLKKYKNYIVYATKSELKTEVINSYLGYVLELNNNTFTFSGI